MQPIRNQIVCKPFPSNEVSEFGIIVPESARKPSNKVTITEVGNGTVERPMKLKEGDVGYRVKDWGQDILIDGQLHYIMDMDAIIAKGD
jgi:chaperonin GroES